MPKRSVRVARIYRGTPRNLAMLAGVLARGGLVATPSETVYGLAGNALDPKACRAIFRAKRRPANDPLIVHIATWKQLEQVSIPSIAAKKLADAFWPGPLTLVLPKKPCVPAVATSGGNSVAVRMPRHPLFRQLIELSGCPLAAPSANPFGYISPTMASHVRDGLGDRIGHILDGGPCEIGLESTIVDLRSPNAPTILRPGAISSHDVARVLGVHVDEPSVNQKTPKASLVAPGTLSKHYSPRTPLTLHRKLGPDTWRDFPHQAFVYLQKGSRTKGALNLFFWSKKGNLAEAAHTCFALLRKLDQGDWTEIHVEQAPGDSALARALNDRLRRAAAKR